MRGDKQFDPWILEASDTSRYLLTTVIFGPEKSGKSTLLKSWIGKDFTEVYEPTIGANVISKNLISVPVKLKIWDLAGHERYYSLYPMYYRLGKLGLCCIDLSNFNRVKLEKQIKDFQKNAPGSPIILIGAKQDLVDEHSHAVAELEKISEEWKLPYILTSAKDKRGFEELEACIVAELRQRVTKLASTPLQKCFAEMSELTQQLPKAKKLKIQKKLYDLRQFFASQEDPQALCNYLEHFITDSKNILGEHPLRERFIRLIGIIATSVFTAFLAFSIGFFIGLGLGAWSGPAAFISAFAAGSVAAYLVATGGIAGAAIGGGITAQTFFTKSNTMLENLSNKLNEVQRDLVKKGN